MGKFLIMAKERRLNVLTVSELDIQYGMKMRNYEIKFMPDLFYQILATFPNVEEIHVFNVDKLIHDTDSYNRFLKHCNKSKSLKRVVFERLPKKYYFLEFDKLYKSSPFDETSSVSDVKQARDLRRSLLQSFIADFSRNNWCIRTFTPFVLNDMIAFTCSMHSKIYLDPRSDFCSILPDFSCELSGEHLDYPGIDADVADVIEAFAGSLERVNLEGVVVRHDTLFKISQCSSFSCVVDLRHIHLDMGKINWADAASRILRASGLDNGARSLDSLVSNKVNAQGLSSIALKQIDTVRFLKSADDVDDSILRGFLQRNCIRDELYILNFEGITGVSLESICKHCTHAKCVTIVECPRVFADRAGLKRIVRSLPNLQGLTMDVQQDDRPDIEALLQALLKKRKIKNYEFAIYIMPPHFRKRLSLNIIL